MAHFPNPGKLPDWNDPKHQRNFRPGLGQKKVSLINLLNKIFLIQ